MEKNGNAFPILPNRNKSHFGTSLRRIALTWEEEASGTAGFWASGKGRHFEEGYAHWVEGERLQAHVAWVVLEVLQTLHPTPLNGMTFGLPTQHMKGSLSE